jgi:hypothetical protein
VVESAVELIVSSDLKTIANIIEVISKNEKQVLAEKTYFSKFKYSHCPLV